VAILIAFYMAFGWLVILPALTLIITAAYYLLSMQRTIFEGEGEAILPDTMHGEAPRDLTWHENAGMLILGVLAVVFGILPFLFFDMMSNWSSGLVTEVILEALNSPGVKP
jgi:NADH-quinone oxidoreductase subunit M